MSDVSKAKRLDFTTTRQTLGPELQLLTQAEIRLLRRLVHDRALRHCLDVGGGTGRLSIPLADQVDSMTLVEPDEPFLATARERAASVGRSNIAFVRETGDRLDLDRTFDLVIVSGLLLVLDDDEARAVVRCIRQHCDPSRTWVYSREPVSVIYEWIRLAGERFPWSHYRGLGALRSLWTSEGLFTASDFGYWDLRRNAGRGLLKATPKMLHGRLAPAVESLCRLHVEVDPLCRSGQARERFEADLASAGINYAFAWNLLRPTGRDHADSE